MAEEKKNHPTEVKKSSAAVSSKGTSWLSRTGKWFARLPVRIATKFKNMWYELKKVSWPTKRKWLVYSAVVLLFMTFMGIVIGLLDLGASHLVRLLVG